MKTLIVLSALAAIAIAAPAQQERKPGFGSNLNGSPHNNLPGIKREKKSPTSTTADIAQVVDSTTSLIQDELDAAPEPSARSFGKKKPIIVKKKHGYHLYRDSAEEQAQADPQDKCTKEVKVKLCDAGNMAKSSSNIESLNAHSFDSDMEQSIKMAKEAVEHLQRDLKNIEHNAGPKMSQWKHSAGSDADMHDDIEVARQALEHIQQNFGNLESMSLRAATLQDADHFEDSLKSAKIEDAKAAQWKEAMTNIQKNIEIARNIEESYKSSSDQNTLSDAISKQDKHIAHSNEFHENTKSAENKFTPIKSVDIDEDLMTTSASEQKESKVNHFDMKDEKSSELISSHLTSAHDESNDEENKLHKHIDMKASENMETENQKLMQTIKSDEISSTSELHHNAKNVENNNDNIEHENSLPKHADNLNLPAKVIDNIASADKMTPESNDKAAEHQSEFLKSTPSKINNEEQNIDEELHLRKHEEDDVDNKQNVAEKLKHNVSGASLEEKEAEIKAPATSGKQEHSEHDPKARELMFEKFNDEKNDNLDMSELIPNTLHFAKNVKPDEMMAVKSSEQTAHETQQMTNGIAQKYLNKNAHPHADASAKLKVADHSNVHHETHQSIKPHHEKPHQRSDQTSQMSEDHDSHNFEMNRNAHLPNEVHPAQLASNNLNSNHHNHHGSSQNVMTQGKSADMDSAMQPSQHVEMKDASDKSALEHNNMLQWKQSHGLARAPYGYGSAASSLSAGSGSLGGAGAVGVFPNANVGGCAIPLLLSCSPSVVSGSLAKAHSSYGAAPAYRVGNDFKFHNKRNIKKSYDESATLMKKTPVKIMEKASLEKKVFE